jgi:hypothetical protein
MKTTLSGLPASLPETAPAPNDDLNDCWILPDSEREVAQFVRPVHLAYQHAVCGLATVMARPIAETFAADPAFYTHTVCSHCRKRLAVREFVWSADGLPLGT